MNNIKIAQKLITSGFEFFVPDKFGRVANYIPVGEPNMTDKVMLIEDKKKVITVSLEENDPYLEYLLEGDLIFFHLNEAEKKARELFLGYIEELNNGIFKENPIKPQPQEDGNEKEKGRTVEPDDSNI